MYNYTHIHTYICVYIYIYIIPPGDLGRLGAARGAAAGGDHWRRVENEGTLTLPDNNYDNIIMMILIMMTI